MRVCTNWFHAPTSVGNLAVTGVGFKPKVVIFLRSEVDNTGTIENGGPFWIGAASSSTSRWAGCHASASNNPVVADQAHGTSTTKCVLSVKSDESTSLAADLVSFDNDGFTLNFTTVTASGPTIAFIAIGGSEVLAKCGTFSAPSAVGNQNVTGIGFAPDCGMIVSFDIGSSSARIVDGPVQTTIGFFALSRLNTEVGFESASATMCTDTTILANRWQISASGASSRTILGCATDGLNTAAEAGQMKRLNDGFSINWTVTPGTTSLFFYVAIKNVRARVGSGDTLDNNLAVAGIESYTMPHTDVVANPTPKFWPTLLMVSSVCAPASSGRASNGRLMFGGGSDQGRCESLASRPDPPINAVIWHGQSTGTTTQIAQTMMDAGSMLGMWIEQSGTTENLTNLADLWRTKAHGFDINYISSFNPIKQFTYLALGPIITHRRSLSRCGTKAGMRQAH